MRKKLIKISNAEKNQIECPECNEILSSNLNRHYKRKHPDVPIPIKERKKPTKEPEYSEEALIARKELEEFSKNIKTF